MRALAISVVLTLVATAVVMARQPAPRALPQAAAEETKTFTSAADVQALLAKAKSERKEGQVMVDRKSVV